MIRRSFFPSTRASLLAGFALLSLIPFSQPALAQSATQDSSALPAASEQPAQAAGAQAPADSAPAGAAVPQAGTQPQTDASVTALPKSGTKRIKEKKTKLSKEDRVVQSKDTRKALSKEKKLDPLVGQDANLPDRQLYDKALAATKRGHFDVARLDLQTLLNTYPDSQYQMRAKLAIADSWYKEGGTAALTQAESEYADFRVFFPNAPEAAEAQMRIGDIYFRQMDKPDRDYAKGLHAEEEYRRMLTDYPNSKLIPQAKQRLREVQEVLATREAEIGDYYASHENWPATIARYQSVADTYPLYSHMDDVLIGLGDAYSAQARFIRNQPNLPEAARAQLLRLYDGKAAAAYSKVVLLHSASPHVEDARDRLAAMNVPIPTPSVEQAQASQALENSRSQYSLQDRARLLVFHQPDVVAAARIGEPPLVDPRATYAPDVTRQIMNEYNQALHPGSAPVAPVTAAAANTADTTPTDDGSAAPAPGAAAAPLALQDVPNAGDPDNSAAPAGAINTTPTTSTGNSGASVGAEIITHDGAPASSVTPLSNGLSSVGPANNSSLPAVEKPAAAPDQINDIQPGAAQPATPAAAANGKKPKDPSFDKGDESSSKHKKKKGVDKLNPF